MSKIPKNRGHREDILYIKNMVCPRCIKVVTEELLKLGLEVHHVILGEVTLGKKPDLAEMKVITSMLKDNGFELIEDRKGKIIEHIKHAILKIVQNDERLHPLRLKHSEFIAREVGKEYHTLSSLFSSVENITIEQCIILQKIERAKELLKYNEMTLSEIAFSLGYSSVQHLSSQFKSVTGMTPTAFKSMGTSHRKPIDRVID